ncbi:MAG: single-stranded-DNA-specific exonuclease RecJ [Candidatus Cloacimonadota bacterium]|nr:MAG: single-stranded-DNA-specific exonuclease RecJ [Candidatus Cloacimonadota bacterium]PIE77896.1 MAG: single-stranded-DNA-specific exonuclease RecJ [Candidatus Delongbacteria bacterium]
MIVVNRKWYISEKPDNKLVEQLSKDTNISEIVSELLIKRKISTGDDIEKFLNPDKEIFHNPFLMKDMDLAVERVIEALVNRESILIWGDYDVDGITSTAVLYLFLNNLGANVSYIIPDREIDGYGLSIDGIREAKNNGVSLIITVDCGITSVEEANFANENGIDIIISDHHEPGPELPKVHAIIDPKRKDCNYPFKHLAGVGVAFKLMQGVMKRSGMSVEEANEHLDIVTIGTSADIVPLVGENRKIVVAGLKKITRTNKIGLRALLKRLNLDRKVLTVDNIIFGMAPRLNAAGRMGDAKRAVRLLTSTSHTAATELVKILEIENNRRKEFDTYTLKQAIKQNEDKSQYNPDKDKAVVVSHDEWHVGVIGIVASRLLEKYHRPSVVISVENGIGKGSCRSINSVNIYNVLKQCKDLLIQFGGHEYAAGLLIKQEDIPEFKRRFNESVKNSIDEDSLTPFIKLDMEISFFDIDNELVEYLEKFKPFGAENKQPLFISYGVEIVDRPRIVGTNHLKLKLKQNGIIIDAIGFNLANKIKFIDEGTLVNICYSIEKNTWNGKTYTQLKIKDIKVQ